ncbi:MAG: SpoIIE family protein phosphatase [Ekhidna sp.]|nr:SpoIIE family protein phosphatase [Ekhidna sp.]
MNIYAKLTILCLALVLFTAGVLSFFADRQIRGTLKDEIIANASQQALGVSTDIGRFMFSRLNEIQMAANNPYFKDLNINREELITRLQELELLNNLYYSFSLFDNDRIRIADSKRLSLGKQHSNTIYWRQLSPDKDIAMDISKPESAGRAMMYFAAKVKDDHNNDIRVFVGRIPINELFKVVGEHSLNLNSTRKLDIHLVDKEGTILYSNIDPSAILNAAYQNYALVADFDKPGVSFLETEDMLYFVTNETGYLTFSGNDWKLILSISKDLALEPLSQIRNQITRAVLPVIVLSIIFSLIAANLFVKPIVNLSKAAEELRKGNLDVKLPIGNDEVGRLAKQLSATSKSLAKQLREQKASNKKLHDQKSQIEIQKSQLEFVSSQIRDSIIYAEHIQRAALPPISSLQSVFPESFVMYKPKDIIGGDFYWFERVRKGNNEFMIIACGDCTGHGIPGSIMSIMGSNQLTNIIYYQNYIDPKKIISRLNKVIRFEFQNDSSESNRDGMEIGICVIDLDTLRLEFSGVGIPLRIVKHGIHKLDIYKPPRQMVGGMKGSEQEVHAMMKKEVVQLSAKDRIFLSSDGFQDQFGGPDDKKFLSRNFNKLLENSSRQSIQDQWRTLESSFAEWSKNTSQTDDVCILGFEIQ